MTARGVCRQAWTTISRVRATFVRYRPVAYSFYRTPAAKRLDELYQQARGREEDGAGKEPGRASILVPHASSFARVPVTQLCSWPLLTRSRPYAPSLAYTSTSYTASDFLCMYYHHIPALPAMSLSLPLCLSLSLCYCPLTHSSTHLLSHLCIVLPRRMLVLFHRTFSWIRSGRIHPV